MNNLLIALRAAAEITRLRILTVLNSSEVTVSELAEILDQSQPRVSRHLKLLVDAGLVQRHQEGSWVFVRLNTEGEIGNLMRTVAAMVDQSEEMYARDQQRLSQVKQRNARQAAEYFSQIAPEWDRLRELAIPDNYVEQKLINFLQGQKPRLLLDIGTGTGRILQVFAPHVERGLGFDLSREMLAVARANMNSDRITNCTVRQSDITQLDIEDNCADVVTIHQVLHYLESPQRVLSEANRVLDKNGRLIIVDFLPHDLEFLREIHAHRHLGISDEDIQSWATANRMQVETFEILQSDPGRKGNQEPSLDIGLWNIRKRG